MQRRSLIRAIASALPAAGLHDVLAAQAHIQSQAPLLHLHSMS
jgi:hypothetical protein